MQLRDLSIENRRYALNIKADMTDDNRLEVLKTNDYNATIKGIHALLVSEPNFFLVNEDFLDTALEVSTIYNDRYARDRLNELKELSDTEIEKRAKSYIEREYLKREFVFTYIDYLELLELDDLLIGEENYHRLLGNPYILHSISYLKKEFSDYYSTNRKADNYLLTILNILEKRNYYDTEPVRSINSVLELFPNREEEKIITFTKKIQ